MQPYNNNHLHPWVENLVLQFNGHRGEGRVAFLSFSLLPQGDVIVKNDDDDDDDDNDDDDDDENMRLDRCVVIYGEADKICF